MQTKSVRYSFPKTFINIEYIASYCRLTNERCFGKCLEVTDQCPISDRPEWGMRLNKRYKGKDRPRTGHEDPEGE